MEDGVHLLLSTKRLSRLKADGFRGSVSSSTSAFMTVPKYFLQITIASEIIILSGANMVYNLNSLQVAVSQVVTHNSHNMPQRDGYLDIVQSFRYVWKVRKRS